MSKVEVFKVPFNGRTANAQACMILDKVNELNKAGHAKVGITYSANQGQTKTISGVYATGKWFTNTSGSNQAEVVAEIEQLLATTAYKHLQSVFRIVPITTMDYSKAGRTASDSDVQASLDSASQFITDGGYLLGWANQLTQPGTLAIGGGIAAKSQTTNQKSMIQLWVTNTFPENVEKQPDLAQTQSHLPQKEARTVKAQTQSHATVSQQPIHKISQAEKHFQDQLTLLDKKITDLEKRKEKVRLTDPKQYQRLEQAHSAADTLKTQLTKAGELFFQNPTEPQYKEFQSSCSEHIKAAHKKLDNHRGWSEFLTNLLLGLTTGGIGLLVKGAINIANNHSFFFVHKTESSKVLDKIEESVEASRSEIKP